MNYIIDGFNLAFKIKPIANLIRQQSLDLAIKQTAQFVVKKIGANKGKVQLVFDGQSHNLSGAPAIHGVAIRFSKKPQLADDIIREFIRSTADISSWTVVSSDNEIKFTAEDHGATAMTSEQFINFVPRTLRHRKLEKPDTSNIDIDYWKKLFNTGPSDE